MLPRNLLIGWCLWHHSWNDRREENKHKSRTIGIVQPINIFAHFTLIHLFYQQSTFDCQWSKLMLFSHISYESESPNQLPKKKRLKDETHNFSGVFGPQPKSDLSTDADASNDDDRCCVYSWLLLVAATIAIVLLGNMYF